MLPPDAPELFMLLKKATKGNPSVSINSESIFFAFTNKAVEDVALNKYNSFEKSGRLKALDYVLGEGLITSEEPKHMHNKKEISPTFHNDHMVEYENRISTIIDSLLSNWSDEVDRKSVV